jgi:hypothetical protein
MFRTLCGLTAALLLGLSLLTLNALADDKEKTETVKSSPAGDAVARLGLASALQAYGRDNGAPEALLTAAGILRRLPSPKGGDKVTFTTKDEDGKTVNKESVSPAEAVDFVTPAVNLVKEAKQLAKDLHAQRKLTDEQLAGFLELSRREEAALNVLKEKIASKTDERSPVGGMRAFRRVLGPGQTDVISLHFVQGQPAYVAVRNSGGGLLALTVRGPAGLVVATDVSHDPSGSWIARGETRGTHFIEVHNRGRVPANYELIAN